MYSQFNLIAMVFKTNKISPCCFTTPVAPTVSKTNFSIARHRRYVEKKSRKNKIEKMYNGLKHVENINTIVQFGQIIGAVVMIL
jgi:hypothetical protein